MTFKATIWPNHLVTLILSLLLRYKTCLGFDQFLFFGEICFGHFLRSPDAIINEEVKRSDHSEATAASASGENRRWFSVRKNRFRLEENECMAQRSSFCFSPTCSRFDSRHSQTFIYTGNFYWLGSCLTLETFLTLQPCAPNHAVLGLGTAQGASVSVAWLQELFLGL